jgi:hypothetical protein
MKIVCIDEQQRWDGHCEACHLPRTVFAVRLDSGAWSKACQACAKLHGASVMQ